MPKELPFSCKSVIPVVTFTDVEQAIPCAEALLEGGIRQIEVTLRSAAGLESIALLAQEVPDITVAAGTVLNNEQLQQVIAAGANAAFSPGFSEDLCISAQDSGFSYVPAVSTASELMAAYNLGFRFVKAFPIKVLGGLDLLKSWHGPFPEMSFCPTGGIRPQDVATYFAFDPVYALGGSWMVTATDLENKAWSDITAKAAAAVQP